MGIININFNIKSMVYPGKAASCGINYNKLYRIPRKMYGKSYPENIPLKDQIHFIFVKNKNLGLDCKNLIIYFHGNSENACDPIEQMEKLNKKLETHSCIVEYPGYGLSYKKTDINPELMKTDAEAVFDFLTDKIGFLDQNIIIMGRSIGTGPAIHLASVKKKH